MEWPAHNVLCILRGEASAASEVYWPAWEMHCNNLRLILGLGLVRVSSRVRVRVSVLVRVSIRTNWVVNFALFCCYRPVIYTRPTSAVPRMRNGARWATHMST